MDDSDAPTPIPLQREEIAAYIDEQSAASIAARVIEFLLAAGGPQAKFATVADRIAGDLGFLPGVAAEVRAFGMEVASLSPSSFVKLQELAWLDCSDGRIAK